MRNLAIIPARSGSKRIPRKNIREFFGRPIIAYSIVNAIKSNLFDEIIVSTNSEEIAIISQNWGAKVPFLRSSKNSNDYATLNDVIKEVVIKYEEFGEEFDNYCCILATNPLLQIKYLTKGFEMLNESSFTSIRPIVKFNYPIQRAYRLTEGRVEFINPQYKTVRSQDIEECYHDSGQFYWFSKKGIINDYNKGGFVISEHESQDIDTEEDWRLAELKYNYLFENK